ncbi:deoxyribose-phosphate aldolase isoform X2 [Puntigrus tetrazona]|uniref:deoxyribose-phosphate aldolase isoform X2 n=1 Tax=Puntigrus tetrazona TaxID=1606681 RepID=UPI001C88E5F2|nr:deoxyribose-phosphate aldolase isoform X2 [Puntigrus tetrazona]
MSARNPGMDLDLEWVSKVRVNTQAVLKRAQQIQGRKVAKKQWQAAWLLKAVTCIDLTTLAGDDTPSNVHRLCMKATQPIRHDLLKSMDMHDKGVTTAAVCVYPSRVADAVKSLKAANSSLPVASVATGFPAGQTPLKTRLAEVQMAVEDGAAEIDIVINRTLALTGQWTALYDEIRQFREACGDAHMKTILAVGELGTFTNVYKASLVSMMAGENIRRRDQKCSLVLNSRNNITVGNLCSLELHHKKVLLFINHLFLHVDMHRDVMSILHHYTLSLIFSLFIIAKYIRVRGHGLLLLLLLLLLLF